MSLFGKLLSAHRMTFLAIAVGLVIGSSSILLMDYPQPTRQVSNGLFNVDGANVSILQITDHNGDKLNWSAFSGKNRLVYFGYTYCPDVCPTELAQMAAAAQSLSEYGIDTTQLFITIDPERDSPEILKEYAPLFHQSLIGLHVEAENLGKLTSVFKIQYRKATGTGEETEYLMDHTSNIFFVSDDGEVRNIFDSNHNIDEMVQEITKAS